MIQENIKLFLEKYSNKNTKRSYKNDILHFFDYLKNNKIKFESITNETIIDYKNSLKEYKTDTQRHKIVLLKGFFNFLMKMNVIEKNLFYIISLPKAQRESKTKYLPKESIEKILAHLKKITTQVNENTKYKNMVFYIAFYFFVYHGLRISEVIKLKLTDLFLDADTPYIRITGKGNAIREHPIRTEFVSILQRYIKLYNIEKYLFKSIYDKEKHISVSTIYRKIVNLGKKITNQKIHPHQIRHFCITQCLENGFDISEVKHFAGHKSVETTIRYDRRQRTLKTSPLLKLNFSGE